MSLRGRTLKVSRRKGLEQRKEMWGVEHPLHSSPNLSLSSGDSAPKCRVDEGCQLPFGKPSPTATLSLLGIPIFQEGAHIKMSHAVLSSFSSAKVPLWSSRGREGGKQSAKLPSRRGPISSEGPLTRAQEK